MAYHFDRVKTLMQKKDVVTINLLWLESKQLFHASKSISARWCI